MRILVVENYPNTTLGLVGEALGEANADCRIIRTYRGDVLPAVPDGFDALILLGGAQDALDDANHPYLRDEVALVRKFAAADRAVLGICLGAQIVARAFGAKNILGRPIEFGWLPVRTTEAGRADPVLSVLGATAPLFHWHLDTFPLPPGAVHLAESDQTAIQAFRVGRAVYGIQFHFEAGTEQVAEWNRAFAKEIFDFDPGWFARHPAEAERHGRAADAAGMALGRAWVGVVKPQAAASRNARREIASERRLSR
ncbi:MAG: type 1 glutamine amidotransferase [Propylenella sp.]